MILLADGGSTKVDWRLIDNGRQVLKVETKGANPFFRTKEEISEELQNQLVPLVTSHSIEEVCFFGAGCANKQMNEVIQQAIAIQFPNASIEVDSDLLAAARGLCGRHEGIACVLGTGSNSCFYDGKEIKKHVSPLGFILGDEGSGAVLGKLFIGACLKNQLSPVIREMFLGEYDLTPATILDKVYKQPLPNRFLAGIAPFIARHIDNDSVYTLAYQAFSDFFIRNVMQYDYMTYPVHLTGSVAYHFSEIIEEVSDNLDIIIGKITQSPMDGLIDYYSTK